MAAAFAGSALLKRLIAERAGTSVAETEKVLDAFNEVARHLLAAGSKVRCLDGYFEVIEMKPTRRRNPSTGAPVDIPARKKIVFRGPQKRRDGKQS
jgi:nucleoid DNA-binding protein